MSHAMQRQRGMTLLELLVAFAIMAISLTMLYRVMGSSARSAGDVERYQRAVVLAQSLLSLRDAVPEEGWHQRGETAGYQWSIDSAPYDTGLSGPTIPRLHEISFSIAWSEGERQRELNMVTLRPQRKPPEQVRR